MVKLLKKGVISIILGQYSGEKLVYKGHVTMVISTEDFRVIESTPKINIQPFNDLTSSNENAVWLEPTLVYVVKFMMKTASGGLRQPVFKGLGMIKNLMNVL